MYSPKYRSFRIIQLPYSIITLLFLEYNILTLFSYDFSWFNTYIFLFQIKMTSNLLNSSGTPLSVPIIPMNPSNKQSWFSNLYNSFLDRHLTSVLSIQKEANQMLRWLTSFFYVMAIVSIRLGMKR